MWELERALASLFGMAAFSLNPAAGAHAELTALLIAKAYFRERGETQRNVVVVPDTAHGTNPASAAMVGFKVLSLKSDARGRVDPGDLQKVVGAETAVCMMTNPNTLGLFEPRIHEVSDVVHEAGGLMYYDGANANALMGNTRPGDMGFDLMHLNLHKTFSIPHGGGGAGAGPVGVAPHLVDYLPTPVVRAFDEAGGAVDAGGWRESAELRFALDFERPRSVGPMRSFWSNFAHMVRALAYCYANGAEGLETVSKLAVLNANYVRVSIARRRRRAVRRDQPARVRRVGAVAQARDRRARARPREGAARPRLSRADGVLPADRPGMSDDRADRDRVEGDAGRFHRRVPRDRRGGEDRSRERAAHAGEHAGRPDRRDARRATARPSLASGMSRFRRPRA